MEEEADLLRPGGKLGALSVPIFCFHEGFDPIAGACFRQMATLSKEPICLRSRQHRPPKELLGAIAVYAAAGLKRSKTIPRSIRATPRFCASPRS
jgi:hypothetical protein